MAARLAKAMGCDAAPLSSRTLLACADAAQVPLYARRAVKWCMENGILTASEKGFEPKGTMNHKEAVDMILALGCWLQNNGPVVRTIPASAVVQATEQHAALQNRINAIAKKYGAVGLSIAYIKDGHVSDTFAYGEAVRGVSAMTADTKVRAASISKVLVGMAASLSAEEGTMTLDTELDTYLGFPIHKAQEGDHITVRSVLTHTSSLRAPEDVSRSYEGMKTRLMSSSATREVCSGNLENWLYNNYAFSALGLAVERANSCTMDELLGHYLYRPLSIDAAFRTGSVSDTKNWRCSTVPMAARACPTRKCSRLLMTNCPVRTAVDSQADSPSAPTTLEKLWRCLPVMANTRAHSTFLRPSSPHWSHTAIRLCPADSTSASLCVCEPIPMGRADCSITPAAHTVRTTSCATILTRAAAWSYLPPEPAERKIPPASTLCAEKSVTCFCRKPLNYLSGTGIKHKGEAKWDS